MKQPNRVFLGMALMLTVAIMGVSSLAEAVSMLKVSDGTTTVVITDEGVNDFPSGIVGQVTYNGSIGNFTSNNVTAVTKPIVGLPTAPFMSIASFNTTIAGGAGTLRITYSDTGYTAPPPMMALGDIGGTTDSWAEGNVRYVTYLGENNMLFEMDHVLTDSGALTGDPFGDSDTALLPLSLTGPYSLTMEIIIDHLGETNTSFGAQLALVPQPEPSTLLLLSSGLAGLLFWGRKRMAVAKK